MSKNKKQYSESEEYTPWDGDISKIPEINTLVAIDLASHGLENKRVCGYNITHNHGGIQIRIHVAELNECSQSNERMLDELHLPLTIREKQLIATIKQRRVES